MSRNRSLTILSCIMLMTIHIAGWGERGRDAGRRPRAYISSPMAPPNMTCLVGDDIVFSAEGSEDVLDEDIDPSELEEEDDTDNLLKDLQEDLA